MRMEVINIVESFSTLGIVVNILFVLISKFLEKVLEGNVIMIVILYLRKLRFGEEE